MHKSLRLSVILILLLLGPVCAFSQFEAGTVTGVVKDPSGALIAGAAVQLTNTATNGVRKTVSNSAGQWNFIAVEPGRYEVKVTQSGLADEVRTFTVSVAQKLDLDITMAVGTHTETVTVNASAEMLETTNSDLGNVRTTQQVQDLPLNSRNFTQLVQLAPGVNNHGTGTNSTNGGYTEGRGTSGAVVNGNPSDMGNYTYDGISSMDADANVLIFYLPVDSIQEFKVQSSGAPASYGNGPSIISVATRSGQNSVHGTVYEFVRNHMFDAKNYFDKPAPAPIPPFHLNQFGGNLSGPIYIPHILNGHNKLFFFADYEGKRQAQSQTSNQTVPTAAFRKGDFSALVDSKGNKIQLKNPSTGANLASNQVSAIDPVSANIVALFPLPNLSGITNNFIYNGVLDNNIDQGDLRIDYRTDDMSLFGRWSDEYAVTNSPGNLPPPAIGNGPGFPGITALPGKQLVLGLGHSIGSTGYYEARLGYSRLLEGIVTQGDAMGNISEKLGIAGANAGGKIPGFTGITITGNASIGSPSSVQKVNNIWEFDQALSFTRGRHEIKLGANWYSTRFAFFTSSANTGSMSFTGAYTGYGLADFLYGRPASTNLTVATFFSLIRFRPTFYVQDTFRATPKLTLNYGIRDEIVTPWKERHNRMACWDGTGAGNIIVLGSGSGPCPGDTITDTRYTNIGPRFGFAYQLNDKTVIRSGFGIFYGYETGNSNPQSQNAPFHGTVPVTNSTSPGGWNTATTIEQGFPAVRPTLSPTAGSNIIIFRRRSPNPTENEFNVNIERRLSSHDNLSLAYVGQTGFHLQSNLNLNQAIPGPGAVNPRRPYPNFGDASFVCYCATSTFNSFQVMYQNHTRVGLDFQGVYTYSHSIDTSSSSSNATDPQFADLNSNRGNSDFDQRHAAVFSWSYKLPFGRGQRWGAGVGKLGDTFIGGWQINNIDNFSTGSPYTPTMGTSNLNTGSGRQRPNRIGSGKLDHPTVGQWFNVADFVAPPAFTYGNSGRNILFAPGTELSDISVVKEVRFNDSGSRHLQFRAEAFNAFNRPQFNTPNASIGSNGVGSITSAGSAQLFSRSSRQVQFAAKLYF